MDQDKGYTQTITPPSGLRINWKELWTFRELFYFFFWRDIKVKYKQTLLGFGWAVLQPMLITLIFVFFFAKTLNIPTDNIPAPIFYFSGLLLWNIFSGGVSSAGQSMVNNAQIIKKNYFPRIILPVSTVLVTLFDFLMALLIFGFMLLYYYIVGMQVSILVIFGYFIAGFLLTVTTTVGMSLTISAFNAKYRDFRYVIPFLIQLLFFLSPVIYPMSIFENSPVSYLLAINPMSSALDLVRTPFTGAAPDLVHLMISACSALVLLVAGLNIFQKMEAYFADII